MSERQWDKKLTEFLKKAGDEIRRTGDELKGEAQKLMEEVRDPGNQQKVKEILNHLGTWTEKTAKEAAVAVETAVKKAEDALAKAMGGQEDKGAAASPEGGKDVSAGFAAAASGDEGEEAAAPAPRARKTARAPQKKGAAKAQKKGGATAQKAAARPKKAAPAVKKAGKKKQ